MFSASQDRFGCVVIEDESYIWGPSRNQQDYWEKLLFSDKRNKIIEGILFWNTIESLEKLKALANIKKNTKF
jgi:hypothetical protein